MGRTTEARAGIITRNAGRANHWRFPSDASIPGMAFSRARAGIMTARSMAYEDRTTGLVGVQGGRRREFDLQK